MLGGYKSRPDCLVWLGKERWANLEIDGEAHVNRADHERDRDLGIPVLRLKTADVLASDLWDRVDRFLRPGG